MKHFIFAFLTLLSTLSVHAQDLDIVSKSYDYSHSINVIEPTVKNFKYLLSLNEYQFEATMKQQGYFEQDQSGKYRSFWNGSLDNFAYTKCVNSYCYSMIRKEVRYMVAADMIYPSSSITNLLRTLRPYYVKSGANLSGNTVNIFIMNDKEYRYEFYFTLASNVYDITVLRKDIPQIYQPQKKFQQKKKSTTSKSTKRNW